MNRIQIDHMVKSVRCLKLVVRRVFNIVILPERCNLSNRIVDEFSEELHDHSQTVNFAESVGDGKIYIESGKMWTVKCW